MREINNMTNLWVSPDWFRREGGGPVRVSCPNKGMRL